MTFAPGAHNVRAAALADEWAVRKLFGALHTYNETLDSRFALADGWEQLLHEHLVHIDTAKHGLTLLAWAGDLPAGLIMMDGHTDSPLFKHRRWVELLALYITPEVQGDGVADALLDAGLAWAHGRGYERVQLYVTASNVRAQRFYARAGFQPVQEIWRRELGQTALPPPPDNPSYAAVYAHGHDLLSIHQHNIFPEEPHEDKP